MSHQPDVSEDLIEISPQGEPWNPDRRQHSLSGSFRLPYGIIPYYTYSVQAVLQDGGNISSIGADATAFGGIYEDATIKEVGIKGSMFRDRIYWAVSAYQQGKTSVSLNTNGGEITSGSVDASKSKGVEFEIRWVPSKQFYLTAYAVSQKSTTKASGAMDHSARQRARSAWAATAVAAKRSLSTQYGACASREGAMPWLR